VVAVLYSLCTFRCVRKITRKKTISFVMYVCPSFRPSASACHNSAPTERIFMKFDIWRLLENFIKLSLKSDNNNGHFTWKRSGFGGLEVACWPLVPNFAGSHPAEAVGFLVRKKILSTPSFGKEVKPSVPCRSFTACKRSLNETCKSSFRQNYRTFSPTVPPSAAGCSRVVTRVETPGSESWNV